MLRIGFLPSDFNPMVLMLGEAEDFRALSGVLRGFSRDTLDVDFNRLGFCLTGETRLILTASSGNQGVQPGPEGSYVWRIDAPRARAFAVQADGLADHSRLAGSELLECSIEEEIPVKLSRGEYTDDFLRPVAA